MPTFLREALQNDILWVSVIASLLAQFLKPFTYQMRGEPFDWHHLANMGGMPSSHSALVCAAATGIGLNLGFDSELFVIAVVLAVVVTYDAAGVRRQAGEHARAINQIIAELLSGHPVADIELKDVLGHSRKEVLGGILFGIVMMLVWKLLIQPLFI